MQQPRRSRFDLSNIYSDLKMEAIVYAAAASRWHSSDLEGSRKPAPNICLVPCLGCVTRLNATSPAIRRSPDTDESLFFSTARESYSTRKLCKTRVVSKCRSSQGGKTPHKLDKRRRRKQPIAHTHKTTVKKVSAVNQQICLYDHCFGAANEVVTGWWMRPRRHRTTDDDDGWLGL